MFQEEVDILWTCVLGTPTYSTHTWCDAHWKNVFESLIGTLLDIKGKTKDGVAARMDLVELGVRKELAPNVGEKKTFLPPACFTLI